jgi:hypothetical protein
MPPSPPWRSRNDHTPPHDTRHGKPQREEGPTRMTPRRGALSGASLWSGAGAGRLHERLAPSQRRVQSVKSARHFLSYCPGAPLSVWRAVSRLGALPREVAGSPKAGPRSGPAFSLLPWRNGPAWQEKTACGETDSSIHFPVMSEGPHVERRTSCVLYIPRIPRDARSLQHAWQGFQPVHLTKEGHAPLLDTPRRTAPEAVHE